MLTVVRIERFAQKQLERVPKHIALKCKYWVDLVETYGIQYARRIPGFHDEPLQGGRGGQRSVRLNRAYRVIYRSFEERNLIIITVLEVNKHDY